ncbi:MAG: hypothetical protein ACD_29C00254G0003 [uncultured bacterium]|nr:MAG: hypothetical protein ACD_29C00254G0003 [uncultured bacterium]
MKSYFIAPSLLSADFARLGEEAQAVLVAGADMLHLDVMDNHYVPNLTIGPLVCSSLRKYGITAPIDVHLMVTPVDRLIEEFAKTGATNITIHPEATHHVHRSLTLIRELGCKAGLALNPSTTLSCLDHVMDKLDLVLIMSVNPGFGGQKFIPAALEKIRQLRERVRESNHPILIAVDGGVKMDNLADIASAGADMLIAGSAIYDEKDYAQVIKKMRDILKNIG